MKEILYFLIIVAGAIEPIGWHYFCKSTCTLHRGKDKATKLHLAMLIGLILIKNFIHDSLMDMSILALAINDIYLVLYMIYGYKFFHINKKILWGCLCFQYILTSIFEYIYTFIITRLFSFIDPANMFGITLIRFISVLIVQIFSLCIFIFLSRVNFETRETLVDSKEVNNLTNMLFILDTFIFFCFCYFTRNTTIDVFTPCTFISIVCEIIMILYVVKIITEQAYNEVAYIETIHAANAQINLVRQTNETIKKSKQITHDMKGHVRKINYYLHEGQCAKACEYSDIWLQAIGESQIEERCATIYDAILYEYKKRAKKNGINFTYMNKIKDVKFSDHVLFTIIDNLVNNAIEACLHIEDKNVKMIDLKLYVQDGNFVIDCYNTMTGNLQYKSSSILPETTKEDKDNHGYGLEIVKEYSEKFGGTMSIQNIEDTYEIIILFDERFAVV